MLGLSVLPVDALNDDATLSAGEKSALLDEMHGNNPATRALLMPEQVNSPEMQALERRLDWLPATLNYAAAPMNSVAPFSATISRRPFGSFSRWCLRWIGCRWRNASLAATD